MLESLEQRRLLTVSTPGEAEFLIIAAEDFVDEVQPLAHWKHIKGYPTYLASMSEVGTTDDDILDFITDAYNTGPETSFVLLVGDHGDVPGYEIVGQHPYYASDYVWHSDGPYACVDGGDLDPDLALGRLPADDEAEVTMMVNKVLTYDRTPDMGSWYSEALTAAYFQDYEEDNGTVVDPLDGTSARMFMETIHRVADFLGGDYDFWGGPDPYDQGYAVHTALTPEDGSFAEYHYGGWSYPGRVTPPDPVPEVWTDLWTSGATATNDISTAVNGGVGLVAHRDHGNSSGSGWSHPSFTTTNVDALTNGDELPVVFSINCCTGRFDDADCFAEAWLSNPNGGGVGVVAPSRVSYSGKNELLLLTMLDSFWGDAVSWTTPASWRPAEALNEAKIRVLDEYGSDATSEVTAREYAWFGDPEIMLRTETPVALDATFQCMVFQGHSTDLTVTVTRGGSPIEGALVCISHATPDDYWVGTTDADGEVTFVGMTTSEIGAYSLVASAHDSVPYEGILYSNGPDQFELNDTICTATVLGSLPKITLRDLSIHSSTDVDLLQYTAQDTGKVIVNAFFNPECGDVDMRVKDIDGNVIVEATETSIAPLRDMAHLVIPVVSQEMYFIEVYSSEADVNVYHLEIENFPAPVPDAVVLDPASDTGWLDNDNLTRDNTPRFLIQADLADFEAMGITLDSNGAEGADVEVHVTGVDTGTVVNGSAARVGATNIWTFTAPLALHDDVYLVSAAVNITDGQTPSVTGRWLLGEPLRVIIDTAAPTVTTPNISPYADSGTSSTDNVTNIAAPAFFGTVTGVQPGGSVQVLLRANNFTTGKTDILAENDTFEITSEPLDDGVWSMDFLVIDLAGNFSTSEFDLEIVVDTEAPNTPYLDLLTDTGRSDTDNITNDSTPDFNMTSEDPNVALAQTLGFTDNLKFRVFDRPEGGPEVLIYDSTTDAAADNVTTPGDGFTSLTNLIRTLPTVGVFTDGVHNLKLEVEDRAGNLSHDFLLTVTIDTVAPPVNILGIDPHETDTGIEGQADTFVDRITSDTATGFVGRAEADAIVRLYVDDTFDDAIGNPTEYSLTVALPEDGNQAFPDGQWATYFIRDLNDPALFPLDGLREVLVTAEDVAGNVNTVDDGTGDEEQSLEIFIDTQGPQVDAVQITDHPNTAEDESAFDLFALKPDTASPTPLVNSLDITFIDEPDRFAYAELLGVNQIRDLFGVDLTSGLATLVAGGGTLPPTFATEVEFDTLNHRLYVTAGRLTGVANQLHQIDTRTGQSLGSVTLAPLPGGQGLTGLEFVGDTLFATITTGPTGNPSRLATIDVTTGAITTVGATGLNLPISALTWDPITQTMYGLTGGAPVSQLVTIDVTTGAATAIGNINVGGFGIQDVGGLAFGADGLLYAGVSQANPDGFDGDILQVDPMTGNSVVAGPTVNAGNSVSGLTLVGFVYPAVNEILATTPGNIQIVGDANGILPIESIEFIDYTVAGDIGRTTVRLNFFEPLPDDRFTLTVSDRISDDVGNALDGESNAAEPQEPPQFPSGDGQPGGDFVARFTVDSRAEIGTWASGSVYVDTNGNFLFDPQNPDFTNRDITYNFGFAADHVFAGNFAGAGPDGDFNTGDDPAADGFDKLAVYGPIGAPGAPFRWAIDTDNDGVTDLLSFELSNLIGMPVAGNFDGDAANGDEVGLYTGSAGFQWWLDGFGANPRDFVVTDAGPALVTPNMPGFPIVGDFDGNGVDDLGTYQDGTFFFALLNAGGAIIGSPTIVLGDYPGFLNLIGVNERPVAADMDGDGIDDIGLWVPNRSGMTPGVGAEWYFLISDETKQADGTVDALNHPFTPVPFGDDIFAQFGDEFAVPVVGNFDPPVAGDTEAAGPAVANVVGTEGNDAFEFMPGPTPGYWTVTVNGVEQTVEGDTVTVEIDGLGGEDTVILTGTDGDDQLELGPNGGVLIGASCTVTLIQVEAIIADTAGGNDTVYLNDSPGDDTLEAQPHSATVTGPGFSHQVDGFEVLLAYARAGGNDTAILKDSAADDEFQSTPEVSWLSGDGFFNRVKFFEVVLAYAKEGGDDVATLYDSPGNDAFYAQPGLASMSGNGFFNRAKFFEVVLAYAREGGDDTAALYDSPGNDTFYAEPGLASMSGSGFFNRAKFFDYVHGYAKLGGRDVAYLYDSPGDDTFVGTPTASILSGSGFYNRAKFFEEVYATASSGDDQAYMYDSAGTKDRLDGLGNLATPGHWASVSSDSALLDYMYWISDFDRADAWASDGEDESVANPDTVDWLFAHDWD